MKILTLLIVSIFALAACDGSKPAANGNSVAMEEGFTLGMVTTAHAAEGCPHLVEINTADGKAWLIPVGLDEQYLKNGTKLKFKYRPSRVHNGGCGKGQPAIMEEVSVQ